MTSVVLKRKAQHTIGVLSTQGQGFSQKGIYNDFRGVNDDATGRFYQGPRYRPNEGIRESWLYSYDQVQQLSMPPDPTPLLYPREQPPQHAIHLPVATVAGHCFHVSDHERPHGVTRWEANPRTNTLMNCIPGRRFYVTDRERAQGSARWEYAQRLKRHPNTRCKQLCD